MMFACQIVEKIATELAVIGFAAAVAVAGYEIAQVNVVDLLAGSSAS